MNLFKALLAATALGVIVVAFRDFENGGWMSPAGLGDRAEFADEEEEPVLGYDGMDEESLLDWLAAAALDRVTLLRMRRYETDHLAREVVLDAISEGL